MAPKITARQLFFVALDVALFFTLCSGMIIFYKHVEPTKRGFFCNDESIRKPYLDSSVPAAIAASVGISCNIILIILIETTKYLRRNKDSNVFSHVMRNSVHLTCGRCFCDFPVLLLKRICTIVFIFMFGAAVTTFLTDVVKYSVGRLRPHFLDVCNPNWNDFNCTDIYGRPVFVTEYQCFGTDEFKLKDARLSFPSGHASFAAYSMLMVVFYLGHEMKSPEHSTFLKPILQLLFLCLGLITGLSRISDYKHHWSDVLAGFCLGIGIALIADRHFRVSGVHVEVSQPHQNGGVKLSEASDNEKLFTQDGV